MEAENSLDLQPWQTKLKDQCGIGVTLDTSRGNKRFKVRYRWRSKIVNLGRFTDAHAARLAYDQAVIRLAPGRKKTNYWPGTHPLNSPAVDPAAWSMPHPRQGCLD
ncbi:hypothetical protein OEZ86_004346 [Tetradesmus obliquus]|nr:hypothetical protein OEZ86_004346 [Tetradesmus obliquus]